MAYSLPEYADMYLILGECGGNFHRASNLYAVRYVNRRHPNAHVIERLDRRLRETGRMEPMQGVGGGRPRHVLQPEIEENILQIIEDEPRQSTRSVARRLNISHTAVHRVLRENLLHPFHFQRVHGLLPEDYPRRMVFCRWLLRQHAVNPAFIENILWTDEATFTRNGMFNMHNIHHWADENPRVFH